MPYFETKATVFGFTQKALSSDATYENWSFHLTGGVKLKLRGRYDLRLGVLSDLHFSNAFVVRSNPTLDVMNVNVGVVYHLPQFSPKHMSKDLTLVKAAAAASHSILPLAKTTQEVFAANVASSADLDLSAITAYIVRLDDYQAAGAASSAVDTYEPENGISTNNKRDGRAA